MDSIIETRRNDGTMTSNQGKRVSITLWPELYAKIKTMSETEGRSLSGQIRFLLMQSVLPDEEYDIT